MDPKRALKDDHTGDTAKPPARASEPTDDRIGGLAKTQSEPEISEEKTIESALEVVKDGFGWLDRYGTERVLELKEDLQKEDEPDWLPQLALSALEVALGAGLAAAGVRVAKKLVKSGGDATTEFVKVLFEQGLGAGIAAGRSTLSRGKDGDVIGPFIEAQKDGVHRQHMTNQTHWTMVGRHRVKTMQEALDLKAACSEENMKAAADDQYRASRDTWVSYLAQAKYGAIGKRDAASRFTGKTTTNMSTRAQRERDNKHAKDYKSEDAPSVDNARTGDASGVLAVVAELPAIAIDESTTYRMYGRPRVAEAHLNDLNSKIRAQYEGQALSESRIPRHVVCVIDHKERFEFNLDERGQIFGTPEEVGRRWLSRRPLVGHPEKVGSTGGYMEGLQLLLAELSPSSIRK